MVHMKYHSITALPPRSASPDPVVRDLIISRHSTSQPARRSSSIEHAGMCVDRMSFYLSLPDLTTSLLLRSISLTSYVSNILYLSFSSSWSSVFRPARACCAFTPSNSPQLPLRPQVNRIIKIKLHRHIHTLATRPRKLPRSPSVSHIILITTTVIYHCG